MCISLSSIYFLCSVKILIVHQHFKEPAKGGAIRSYYLADALRKAGHHVVVISASNEKHYYEVDIEGIRVCYVPVPYDNAFSFYARSVSFVKFLVKAARVSRGYADFDYCYAISVPLTVGLVARWNKWRMNMKYIFEVGDLWPDAPVQMGFVKNYFLKSALYNLERSIYKEAESVVALSPAIQIGVENKVPGKKVHLIPNMSDCDFYSPEEKSESLELKFGVRNKFVVSYIGALGIANGLDYFIECANASRKGNLPIHFLLCGEGAMKDQVKADIARLGLQNISVLGFVNREGVREVLNVTDASFICYKNVPILETGSPNKFFDGLAAGKLIITNFGGWIKDEIERTPCGIFLDPKQPADFVKKVAPFISDLALLKGYQAGARVLAEKKYSRGIVGERFAGLFKDHASTSSK